MKPRVAKSVRKAEPKKKKVFGDSDDEVSDSSYEVPESGKTQKFVTPSHDGEDNFDV